MTKEYSEKEEKLARFAKAMGHPARIAILKFLAAQESCFFGDIHEVLPIAKATVSQHLSELKEAGLIQGEIIQPKVKYCINRENWELARRLHEELFGSLCKKKGCCS
jgi:DNA-binding transcriptional ArsR family regulator